MNRNHNRIPDCYRVGHVWMKTLLHLVPAEPPFGLRALCKMEVHRESLRDKPSEVSRKIPRPRKFCPKCMDLAARVSVSR